MVRRGEYDNLSPLFDRSSETFLNRKTHDSQHVLALPKNRKGRRSLDIDTVYVWSSGYVGSVFVLTPSYIFLTMRSDRYIRSISQVFRLSQ